MSTFNIRGFVRAACFGTTPTNQLLAEANRLRGEGAHGFADLAIEELKRRTCAEPAQ